MSGLRSRRLEATSHNRIAAPPADASSFPSGLKAPARMLSVWPLLYSSVHRGAGYKSQLVTCAYEDAREAVRSFVGGRPDDAVVFTRNTTDALDLLAAALPPETEVFAFAAEHHANLLPWRRGRITLLPVPASPADALDNLDRALGSSARGW